MGPNARWGECPGAIFASWNLGRDIIDISTSSVKKTERKVVDIVLKKLDHGDAHDVIDLRV